MLRTRLEVGPSDEIVWFHDFIFIIMSKNLVIIPTYNEKENIENIIRAVQAQPVPFHVLVVDDGSPDGTADIVKRLQGECPDRLFIVERSGKLGLGTAYIAGFKWGLEHGYEYIFEMDADFSHNPADLPRLYDACARQGADVAICRAVEFDTNSGRELPSQWMMKKQYLPGKLAFAPQEMADHLFQFTYGMPWDKFYRRELLTTSGIRYPALKNSEDLAFVYPTLLAAKGIAVVDEVLIHHRINRMASVSNSRCGQPEAPYEAFQIVKEYLEQHQLMDTYRRSFLNWAMEFLVWHISNMSQRDIQKQYLNTLRHQWLPQLHFEEHPASYYESKSCYAKYLLARYAPYPVFAAVVKVYKKAKHGGQ